jgi:hypothetical protein
VETRSPGVTRLNSEDNIRCSIIPHLRCIAMGTLPGRIAHSEKHPQQLLQSLCEQVNNRARDSRVVARTSSEGDLMESFSYISVSEQDPERECMFD